MRRVFTACLAICAFCAFAYAEDRASFSGVVTMMRPLENYFFMQTDGGEAWRVSMDGHEGARFAPGDLVSVEGELEPKMNRHTRRLFSADVRKTGHDESRIPSFREMGIKELCECSDATRLPDPDWYAEMVSVEGTVHDFWRRDSRTFVVLTDGRHFITYQIEAGLGEPMPEHFAVGALARARGVAIYQTRRDSAGKLTAIENIAIFTAKMADFVVLSRPPFWTTGRLWALVGAVVAALAVMGVWVVMLRRAVAHAVSHVEAAARQRAAAEATVRERLRLSHDLHDDFQQLLASCSFRLAAAVNYLSQGAPRDEVLKRLDGVETALQHTQAGLRSALWSLNEEAEGPSRFSDLIRYAASRLAHWSEVVTISFEGKEPPIARRHAGTLLMVLQEAVANAIRHGRAKSVRVEVSFGARELAMLIVDDGCGFDTAAEAVNAPGHMGLSGMRTRVANLGGTFAIESETGRGTTVTVKMPL